MMSRALKRKAATGIIATSVGLAAASAGAQGDGSRQAREYVAAAASADQFEIAEAETVLAQSTNPEVRSFATHMLEEHQRHGQAVKEAAARSGLKPPEMAMSADQAQLLGGLQGVSGSDFDKLYLKQQTLAHRSALVVEQIYAKSGDDPGLRQFAKSAVPMISEHEAMASQLEAKLLSN